MIAGSTYLATSWVVSESGVFAVSIFGAFFLSTCAMGMIVDFSFQRGVLVSPGTQITAIRSIVLLELFLLVLSEITAGSQIFDPTKFLYISQIIVLAAIIACITLIPPEKQNIDSEKASEYETHGGMR
ncbi:MAG TPA: hypothetical protein DCX14_14645 [Flavobacteriales bacterium]|nr:hypothetical protein [Flavobacteriales bacterium]